MKVINFIILLTLVFPLNANAICPCFDQYKLEFRFRPDRGPHPSAICYIYHTDDSFGLVQIRTKSTSIISEDGKRANVMFIEKASLREFDTTPTQSEGLCKVENMKFLENKNNLNDPKSDYLDCSQILLNICINLNIPIIYDK